MAEPKHIIALEGEWENTLTKPLTVASGLRLLTEVQGIKHLHRRVATREGLLHYLRATRNRARYPHYDIVYLALHGTRSALHLSDGEAMGLRELADACEDWLAGKWVHFSSCQTAAHEADMRYFREQTGAKTVSGYTKKVDFLPSLLLDMALMEALQHYDTQTHQIRPRLEKHYQGLMEDLGFVIYHS